MITSKTYSSKLDELLHVSYREREVIPSQEPVFNVDLNTRTIEVPGHFRNLATKGDHNAETIWFALDRYFDGKDLSLKSWEIVVDDRTNEKAKVDVTWAVQFVNALGEESLHPIVWKNVKESSAGQDSDFYKEGQNATLNLGWDIHYDLTKAAGRVSFSLRCYVLHGSDIIYNISTEPVTAYIKDGLYIEERNNENLMNPPKDNLSDLVAKISSLYENTSLTNLNYENINKGTLPTIDGTLVYGNMTSADFKNIDYKQILNTPIYKINGEELEPGGNLELLTEADAELKVDSTNPIQNKPVAEEFNKVKKDFSDKMTEIDAAIAAINEELENMTYIPLEIKSFSLDPQLYEVNSSYTGDITFTWEFNGNIATLELFNNTTNSKITDLSIDTSKGTTDIGISGLNKTTEYKLVATDAKGNKFEEFAKAIFAYKLFYGVSTEPEEYSADFIQTLENSSIQETKETIFTATPDNEYIYFALPQSYGKPIFTAGGFDGGFGTVPVASIIYNKTIYDIWRTDYLQKEAVEIKVR